nr:hypothetical protein B0A51_14737 [Rachicladosporium sp. CCFEE 5018]
MVKLLSGSAALLLASSSLWEVATAQWEYRSMSGRSSRRSAIAPPPAREYTEVSAAHVKRFEGHVRKRDTSASDDVDLQTAESWYWGGSDTALISPSNSNPALNLTGVADNSTRYLSLERFSDSIKSVDCDGNNIKITFNSKDTYNDIQSNWKWINTNGRTVYVVLAPNTCSNTRRQPYSAQTATFDSNSNAATFTANQATWSDAIKQGNLHFNTQGIQAGSGLSKRLIPVDETKSIDVTKDFSQTLFSKEIPGTGLTAEIDCATCGTRGKFNIEVNAEINVLSANTGFAKITPDNLGADIVLGFKVGGELTSELSAEISAPPIILAGIDVPGVLTLGPLIRLAGKASLTAVSAEAQLTVGAKLDVPQDSIAQVDFSNSANNQLSGWSPVFTAVGPDLSASVSVSGEVGPVVSLEISINALLGKIQGGAGLAIAAPQLNLALTANADTAGGVCGNPSAQLGVEVDVGLSAELDAFAAAAQATFSRFATSDCTDGGQGVLGQPLNPGDCIAATNAGGNFATFNSGKVDSSLLDTTNGCIIAFYSDSGCATQASILNQDLERIAREQEDIPGTHSTATVSYEPHYSLQAPASSPAPGTPTASPVRLLRPGLASAKPSWVGPQTVPRPATPGIMAQKVTINFSSPGLQPPVFITTSLSEPQWDILEMGVSEDREGNSEFTKIFHVQPGEYQYKFRLGPGDWWVCDEEKEVVDDGMGNRNNHITVAEPSLAFPMAPQQEVPTSEPRHTARLSEVRVEELQRHQDPELVESEKHRAPLLPHESSFGHVKLQLPPEDVPVLPSKPRQDTIALPDNGDPEDESYDEPATYPASPLFRHETGLEAVIVDIADHTPGVDENEDHLGLPEHKSPLLSHEVYLPTPSPQIEPSSAFPTLSTGQLPAAFQSVVADEADPNDKSLEHFPTTPEAIVHHIRRLSNRMPEDEVTELSLAGSPNTSSLPAMPRTTSQTASLPSVVEEVGEEHLQRPAAPYTPPKTPPFEATMPHLSDHHHQKIAEMDMVDDARHPVQLPHVVSETEHESVPAAVERAAQTAKAGGNSWEAMLGLALFVLIGALAAWLAIKVQGTGLTVKDGGATIVD